MTAFLVCVAALFALLGLGLYLQRRERLSEEPSEESLRRLERQRRQGEVTTMHFAPPPLPSEPRGFWARVRFRTGIRREVWWTLGFLSLVHQQRTGNTLGFMLFVAAVAVYVMYVMLTPRRPPKPKAPEPVEYVKMPPQTFEEADGNPEPPTPPLPPPPDPYDGPISHLERFSYDSEEKIMEARRKDAEDSYRERVKLREKEAREKEDRRIAAEKRRGCQS